ncbi:MAG: choice-of-anchor D domain-containing protein [Desulfobacteraceae bacterium]|nr:choice-of-anchor D domain-containing protein [Desulfobacteraceae bacterium]
MRVSLRIRTFAVAFVCVSFVLALLVPYGTATQKNPSDIKVVPLFSPAQDSAVPTPVKRFNLAEASSDEDKATQLSRRLRRVIEEQGQIPNVGFQNHKKSLMGSTKRREHPNYAAVHTLTPADKNLDVHYRSATGTPRQIKVTTGTASKLRKAMEIHSPGSERDKLTSQAFLREQSGLLHLPDPDRQLKLSRYWEDVLGRKHIRYSQMYNGIPVWPAELNVHLDANSNVDLMNGAYVAMPHRLVLNPVLNAGDAEGIAINYNPDFDSPEKIKSELIIYAYNSHPIRLAWKVQVLVDAGSDWLVIVDALNGNILKAYNQVKTNAAKGSGVDLLWQTRSLNIWAGNNMYYLIDTSKPMYYKNSGKITVYDMNHYENLNYASFISSTSANSGWLKDGVSLSYNISETFDYYQQAHNRNSIDGEGGNVLGYVRYKYNEYNAYWNNDYKAIFFGDAKPFAAALDIVAHELTHGITSCTCKLVYSDQSGAINEAFSDIFGEMVENRTNGSTDWVNGKLVFGEDSRNLKNPSSVEIIPGRGYYYPSKMSEFYHRGSPLLQMMTDADYGGVHINMTIITHAYYLLTEGLNGAIGLSKAAKIFYRAQTVHLVSNSQFIDMRLACIRSAEELYGENSQEAQKVAEAFDAVEILDNQPTPEPEPAPAVSGDDSYIYVSYNSTYGNYYLARREADLNDGYGRWLSYGPVSRARPSVSGDGTIAFFTDAYKDACFIDTDGKSEEAGMGMAGQISSVAMSPDAQLYGFVMLDYTGAPTNQIIVIDLRAGGQSRIFDLVAPATEGETVNTVVHADSMDFTSDNRYLIYDAYNILKLADGSQIGVWSIYAIDLVTEQTIALIAPVRDYDIGFPSISQTTNHLITWDQYAPYSGTSTIVAASLITGKKNVIGSVNGGCGVPGYNGDDTSIAYSQTDAWTSTGYSMARQGLARNGYTPSGNSYWDLFNAEFGVIYRRGSFSAPVPDIGVSVASLSFGSVYQNSKSSLMVGIKNNGDTNLMIEGVNKSGEHASMFTLKGGCMGQTLPADGSCSLQVEFTPDSTGLKQAMLSILSNDPDTPTFKVTMTGQGVTIPGGVCLGDCNNDGSVSISEVQAAVNQFLEINNVQSCNDKDGNGRITINELQEVVNNFLKEC